jgi:CheY-like chemotaxis protein
LSGDGHILIVEDDQDLREMVATLLQGEGYAVIEAEHGRAALDKLHAAGRVCLILLDLYMPTMNGWAFRQAQLTDPAIRDIPVVVVSADPEAARQAASLGVVASMTKPIDFDRLLSVVGRYC